MASCRAQETSDQVSLAYSGNNLSSYFVSGDMLGLISSESYATAVRGTCYGISAALGKTGAAVGTEVFTPIQNHLGKRWTFIIAAICGLVGIFVTWVFVPNLGGEDLALEDERFRAYLVTNGWLGEMGEDDLKDLADRGIPSVLKSEEGIVPDVVTSGKAHLVTG